MELLLTYLGVVFVCGLIAWAVRLPPLIGFLAAGFALHAAGVEHVESLDLFADIGVTLMLFAIGLRLDLKALTDKAVWLTASAHVLVMTLIGAGFITALGALGAFGPTSFQVAVNVALVLSFSSTIVVIKILQDRGDEQALYGNICIGVLIMQDILAVAFMSILRGEPPHLASLLLVVIVPLLALTTRRWYKLGHGELGALFGIAMALIPGYALFEWVGLSGSLGALIMGVVLSRSPGAEQLSHSLFTLKELLLVGFFVNIGFMGLPNWQNVADAALLLLLLPLQAVAYWAILWSLGLRNRTSVLTALLLANYSEFALIIAAVGVQDGWLNQRWLLSLVLAVSISFVISAIFNPQSVSRATHLAKRLPVRPPHKIHPDDRPIELGDAHALVLGVGRVGLACYNELSEVYGAKILGVEHDPARVRHLQERGYNVVEGDATDIDFWERVKDSHQIDMIMLAMPAQHANVDTVKEIHASHVDTEDCTISSVAMYREDVEALEELGLDVVVHLQDGAGESLAERTFLNQEQRRSQLQ
ncbi:cation:proton antiporter family protein [Corynebacterium urealyticum]|uniref:cation:proton antiporter family protein n=1 Tax=Corynebacterium urealyticum TaxID=43771 RepID=UPI00293E3B20|nr:cation:proton antiporter family protein [Corynebacterium urealyticum]WOH93589.1 cation:proton antiporter family protein [Corynebacterium urealyticum]